VNDLLAPIISDALDQAEALLEADVVQVEAWASDLVSLALEADPTGLDAVVAALIDAPGVGSVAALWALDALVDGLDIAESAFAPAPPWGPDLLTAHSDGVFLLNDWRGQSAAFTFVDANEARHVLVIDFVPGSSAQPETLGEAMVGPAAVLSSAEEEKLRVETTDVDELVRRVTRAWGATAAPPTSLVALSRLAIARLTPLGATDLKPLAWVAPEVQQLDPIDPDDAAWARDVLDRAVGDASLDPFDEAFSTAAATLREAASVDDDLAQWLAASVGPVDLDANDRSVVLAALAATVAPQRLEPLTSRSQQAVVDLEFADWLGVVIGLVRAGPNTSAEPDALVDLVNRCPEVTTTIPKADRARVAWALAVVTEGWEPLGITTDGAVTAFGAAVLPAALREAWEPPPASDDR